MRRIEWTTGLFGLLLLCGTIGASAQERPRGWSVNYVAPQVWRRARSQARHRQPVVVTGVEARISLSEQVATTTLLIRLHNPSRRQHQAVILLPVPAGAAIRSFDFHGAAKEPTASCSPPRRRGRSTAGSWPSCAIRRCSSSSTCRWFAPVSFRFLREGRRR